MAPHDGSPRRARPAPVEQLTAAPGERGSIHPRWLQRGAPSPRGVPASPHTSDFAWDPQTVVRLDGARVLPAAARAGRRKRRWERGARATIRLTARAQERRLAAGESMVSGQILFTVLFIKRANTRYAHRLIWLAGREGVQDAVMEAVFAAYFTQGRDIGDHDVLADCASQGGMDHNAVADFLAGQVAAQEMLAADRAAREAGVNGVPSFFLDGYGLYSGAMPAETMAEALSKGHQILRQRAA